MSISSLTAGLSLATFLNGTSASQSQSGGLASYMGGGSGSIGDTLSLSTTAQGMAQAGGTGDDSKAKNGAKAFLLNFFQDKGVDVAKLSDDAIALLQGIDDMITDMGGAVQDSTVDTMTANYVKGQRQSYTLTGQDQRLSFTVQYENGKPASMAVMHIQGKIATRAVISLTENAAGIPTGINVQSVQKEYGSFGNNTATNIGEELDLKLYA